MVRGDTLAKAEEVYKKLLEDFPWKDGQIKRPIRLLTSLEEELNYFKLPWVEKEEIADGIEFCISHEVKRRFESLPSEQPIVFYHGTFRDNVPSILQHGLLSKPPANAHGDFHFSGGGVYVTPSFRTAQYFAGCKEHTVLTTNDGAVIEVVLPKNKVMVGSYGIRLEAVSTEDVADVNAVYLFSDGTWQRYKVNGKRLNPHDKFITSMPLTLAYTPPSDFDTALEIQYERLYGDSFPVVYQNHSALVGRLNRILKSTS